MFETIHSEKQYHGRAFAVRQDQVRLPDDRITQLDIVEHSGAVTILPIDANQDVFFVRQYRHAAGVQLLELPAGTLELGEDPLECARREIQEEVGMAAGHLHKLGEFFLAPGYSTEYMYVFLATDLSPSVLPADDDEFLSVERISYVRVLEMAQKAQLRDAKTLAALMLAREYLAK